MVAVAVIHEIRQRLVLAMEFALAPPCLCTAECDIRRGCPQIPQCTATIWCRHT